MILSVSLALTSSLMDNVCQLVMTLIPMECKDVIFKIKTYLSLSLSVTYMGIMLTTLACLATHFVVALALERYIFTVMHSLSLTIS